jgi:3-dehydroquinate synthetase
MIAIEGPGYPILVGDDPAVAVRDVLARSGAQRAIVLADRNVAGRAKLLARAAEAPLVLFKLGERRKTLRTVARALEVLLHGGADRRTLVFGAGGGVATDLFGFAASIYMRGVPFAPVATSVVAMADASIGGKTGVDFAARKNLAGTFRDPVAVLCDLGAIETLRRAQLREGLAEIVKAAVIAGEEPFGRLEALAATPLRAWPWDEVIRAAVETKCAIVAGDRLEAGRREVLNLGHTFGHAIESVAKFEIPHGSAVAIGLRAAGLLGLEQGGFAAADHARVVTLLQAIGLPVRVRGLRRRALLNAMRGDKKARDGRLRFVVPSAIGNVRFGVDASDETVERVLDAVAKPPGDGERS